MISLDWVLKVEDLAPMPPGFEEALALLVALAICGFFIYWFTRWVWEAPQTADPWGHEMEEAVNHEGAVPVCHHCLTPQEHNGWFCPECGTTVGPYCNYMPYVYVFSEGEVLRAGVTERIRRSAFITAGFVLLSIGAFAIAAPIYWVFLFKNLRRAEESSPEVAAS